MKPTPYMSMGETIRFNVIAKKFYSSWVKFRRRTDPEALKNVLSFKAGIHVVAAQFIEMLLKSLLPPKEWASTILLVIVGEGNTREEVAAGEKHDSHLGCSLPPGVWTRTETENFFNAVHEYVKNLPDVWFRDETLV